MADCIHEIGLCDDCGGLQTTRLDLVPGVSSIQLDGDSPALVRRGAMKVYIGPVPGPCPNGEVTDRG